MISKMYSVYDVKSKLYQVPFHSHNDGHAIRCFTDMVRHEKSHLSRYPEDFILFNVGSFDDESGVISPLSRPIQIIVASECVVKTQLKEGLDKRNG